MNDLREALVKVYRVSQELGHLWSQLEWPEVEDLVRGIFDPAQAASRIRDAANALSPEWGGISPEWDGSAFVVPAGRGGVVKAHLDGALTTSYEKEEYVGDLGVVVTRALVIRFRESRVSGVWAKFPAPRDFARLEAIANTAFDQAVSGLEDLLVELFGDVPEEYEKYRALYFQEGLASVFVGPREAAMEIR